VLRTLIPLARSGIIHSDLRHGYDDTANILYHEETFELRIIDLNSLIQFKHWLKLPSRGRRNITINPTVSMRSVWSRMSWSMPFESTSYYGLLAQRKG
jgi:hypothetical protein